MNPDTLPVLVEDYLEDLEGMEHELFEKAWREARRSCRFFPKSRDIIEASKRVVPTYSEFIALPEARLPDAEQAAKNRMWARRIRRLCDEKRSPYARQQ